ncbi:phospho-N-acetylmuramoyl-pentapeptide-transferase [Pseudobacter ginsenosidimutans]|jgi:phospho-N-acetylmuramoyl-pentapeptide-transferase|uniref:Phospho-N-acetylmuramoyl-pentapeptide-transferase n=1 Tax=Pseudobacter ginsenosidimutans TaxID=661488 RepID=A0A4Q7MSD9_9BACT|nr:phospho-N-acetylmuramoyl-pentapeptide-transferase [Pseudobacter ginsenosidimutans]QEC42361.1 phospho-N-acetylmuramoyl-pentapeptide-transferase [Pseudobacter ginsenosidimutans]RZS70789.1 phospho-N-acetylmuramoyl-pentapeptide-transferase [Pseudobacter ginsenosidimutans]
MLYHLTEWLRELGVKFPGSALFQFITSRVMLAVILSLLITTVFGKKLINYLRKKQVGETVRDLGLAGEQQKKGTPTMGGLIIILAILVPTLLLADLNKAYIRLMIFATIWLGIIGFIDDYLKLRAKMLAKKAGVAYKKGDKDGLAGWFKVLGQVVLGVVVGCVILFNQNTKVWRDYTGPVRANDTTIIKRTLDGQTKYFVEADAPITTIPFVKSHEFNYSKLLPEALRGFTWLLYIGIVIFIVTAVSNGANITDGLDGLATGTSAIIGACLGIFAYASGNLRFAEYLNIMYIPNLGELSIFIGALIGACVGFLWYNAYPAQVFMGDTGSLTLGGIIAALAIIVRKELLIPIFCGVFLVEVLSVTLQVSWFKYTKKKYGEGRRIFLMSPLHHHYQKLGYHESKIVTRFWIVTILCIVFAVVTLKIR